MVDISSDLLPYIKSESMPKSYTLFQNGDVAFADASEDTNDVAKAVEIVNCDEQQIVSGLHTIHGRDKSDLTVIGYKGYAFASDSFHKQIRRIAQGTKVFSINVRNFDEVRVGIPSKDEQIKIAKLLRAIDLRIATQNKIIDKLQSLIKGLYSVLFQNPSNKNSYCLGEISTLYQPTTISSSELNDDGKYLVYGANGIIGKYDTYNHEFPQITITCRGNTCGTVNFTSNFCWITGNSMVVNIEGFKAIVNQRYLFHYLKNLDFSSVISGSGQPQIVRTPLAKLKIYLPTLTEQQKTSTNIDIILTKLSLEQSILGYFQLQKNYLLQQMFI